MSKLLRNCTFIDETLKSYTPSNIKRYLKSVGMFYKSVAEIENFLREIYPLNTENLFQNSKIGLGSGMHFFDAIEKIDICSEFIFKREIDKELTRLRDIYDDLPKYLDEVAKKVASENNISISIIYFPQLGYLIETNEEMKEWDEKFKISDIFYYKNNFMETLDSEFGDLKNRIEDIEIDVSNLLLIEISKSHAKLKSLITNVDCFVSLSISAEKFNLVKGEISKDRDIELVGFSGFAEKVQNNLYIKRNLIITGSNGSGKSTLLRNIANIVILNQMGSFLPCKYARLPIFDKIFTKFTMKENTSSFKFDILQLSEAIKFATKHSLVLIDEFGKGSDLIDGISLLLSVIKNFCYPRVLITTHFQTFFAPKTLSEYCCNRDPRKYKACESLNLNVQKRHKKMLSRSFECMRREKNSFHKLASKSCDIELEKNQKTRAKSFEFIHSNLTKHFEFLKNYDFFFLESVISKAHQRFQIRKGTYLDNEGIEYAESLGFSKEFIFKCRLNKKRIIIPNRKKRNDHWAIKLIQEFITN